jgi:excinuclease ABC subunit A
LDELLPLIKSLKLSNTIRKLPKIIIRNHNPTGIFTKGRFRIFNLKQNIQYAFRRESQRINLATSLGSSLVGSIYILDEPSIGLHSKDTENLIEVLKNLRDLGNTVIVVEHDEDVMRAADYIIDIGPEALVENWFCRRL